MKFNLQDINKALGNREKFELVANAGSIGIEDEGIETGADLCFSGEVYNCGDEFVVEGKVIVPYHFLCSLCLKSCSVELSLPFSEVYKKDYQGDDFQSFSDCELDFTEALYETVITSIPLKPICSDSCRGLCLQCGQDKNITNCTCSSEYINPKMAALKQLLEQTDE